MKWNRIVMDAFKGLMELIKRLRGKDGCPWDRKQTPGTMARYLLEETYELVSAIESGNVDHIREELGDVLFHVFFIAHLFGETDDFDITGVTREIQEKMIRRHPHVFGNSTVKNADDVKRQWQEIKKEEKNGTVSDSTLDSVPRNLPALMRAFQLSEKAAETGFDWQDIGGVMEKVEEEWEEFKSAMSNRESEETRTSDVSMEFGDILFSLVNVARFAEVYPESSLAGSSEKFEKRFRIMETKIRNNGRSLESIFSDPEKMDRLWDEAKKTLERTTSES